MDGSGDFVTKPKYYWSCCFVCRKVSSPSNPLKRCARCHSMFYCSKEHQREDWKQHKKLCSYLSTAAEEVGADNFFGQEFRGEESDELPIEKNPETDSTSEVQDEEIEAVQIEEDKCSSWKSWTKFRINAFQMCQILIGRQLEEWEKEIFFFPRACRVCRLAKTEGMLDCYSCGGATYCCDQHKQQNVKQHEMFCHELKYAMVCDNFESTVTIAAPPLPPNVDSEMIGIGGNMLDHLRRMEVAVPAFNKENSSEVDLQEMEFRFLTNSLSSPLTIIFAYMESKKPTDKESLVFHIAGSNVMEMLGIIKWEYILHRLPAVKSIRFVFIGLELSEEEEGECSAVSECTDCLDAGRTIRYEIRKKTYKAYAESGDYIMPDLVCVFNCGFHEFVDSSQDTWTESLPYLSQHSEVPLVFTSYSKSEAIKDLGLIQKSRNNLEIKLSIHRNPYRSFRPIRDFAFDDDCDVFYGNNYLSLVWQN